MTDAAKTTNTDPTDTAVWPIGSAVKLIGHGVTVDILREWHRKELLVPAVVSEGSHRYYTDTQILEAQRLRKKQIKQWSAEAAERSARLAAEARDKEARAAEREARKAQHLQEGSK